ncbi:MAG: nucleotidyl transferase AbiEii/AbiGii toxin family protein [Tomitella sp.]|nr:nucleotidyl transferase AbiEii/AbiGii toxin family protein [Tomitella sp.]
MNRVEEALRRIACDLHALEVRWALVGGFAVSVRTEPRFTRDVDVAVAVDGDPAAERLVAALTGAGYRLDAIVEQDAVGRLATARMIAPGADRLGVVVDLLFATAGIEPEVVDSAELLEVLPGVPMPVATVGHLVALKLLARDDETRPQDSGDLRALRAVLGVADRAAARSAAALIVERGFARDRPLVELTDAYLTG